MQSVRRAPADQRVLFECDGRACSVRDVISAAEFRGDLIAFREVLIEGLACQACAAAQDFEVDDAVLQKASEDYRKTRNLSTAEGTRNFFDDRGIDLDAFSHFLERYLLRAHYRDQLQQIREEYTPSAPEIEASLYPELVLSGYLSDIAQWTGWRIALEKDAVAKVDEAMVSAIRSEVLGGRDGALVAEEEWCERHHCDTAWFMTLLRLEASFRQRCDEILSLRQLQQALDLRHQDLLQVGIMGASVSSEDVAREIMLCVSEDGLSFTEACAMAGLTVSTSITAIESVNAELRPHVLSAALGDVIKLSAPGGGQNLYCLVEKSEPDLEDTAIRNRIAQEIVERHFNALAENKIRWRSK